MKLSQLIKICDDMLGLGSAAVYFDMPDTPDSKNINKLLSCFGNVFDEIYRDYATSLRKTVVEATDGFVDVKDYKLCKVISLTDSEGNDVPFRYSDGALFVRQDGKYNMCYSRMPDCARWQEEVPLPPNVGVRAVVYGVLREYCASIGDWSNAEQWDERYKNAVKSANCKLSAMRMPARGWR